MPARKLDRSILLPELREEIVWTWTACKADPVALVHAGRFEALLTEWKEVFFRSLTVEDALVAAEQLIDRIDLRIDGHIDDFHNVLLGVVGQQRKDERYALYFDVPPSRLKRPVLGAELETVRSWLPLLEAEDDARLVPFHAIFAQDVKDADAAVAARSEAEGVRQYSRQVGEIARFVDRVGLVRDEVFGALDQHRAEHPELDLPRDFASRFFLKGPRREPSEEELRERAEARARERAEALARAEKRKAARERLRQARRELAELAR